MSITTKHVFGAAAVLFACMQANAQTGAGNARKCMRRSVWPVTV
jgi:hypothetical protein